MPRWGNTALLRALGRMLLPVVAMATLVQALILVCGLFGAQVPVFDFLNNFAPFWLITGIATGIAWRAIGQNGRWPLISVAAILLCGGVRVLPDVIRQNTAPPPAVFASASVRIVQFNTWKDNPAPLTSARWLLDQDADVLFLDEAAPEGPILRALAPAYPYRQTCGVGGRCTTVLLSRIKPLASGGLARDDPENRRGLSAAWMRLATRCGPMTVVATHMSRPWPWPGADRDLDQLAVALDAFDRRRVILAGDFNLTPWTARMAEQDRRVALARATRALPTWPSPQGLYGLLLPPLLPLDHIYTGSLWRVDAIKRGPAIGSDHYPLAATIHGTNCPPQPPRS